MLKEWQVIVIVPILYDYGLLGYTDTEKFFSVIRQNTQTKDNKIMLPIIVYNVKDIPYN